MTKEQRSDAIKISFEGMEEMQAIIDTLPERKPKSEKDKLLLWAAKTFYNVFWIMYQILLEIRKDKKK